MAKKTIKRLKHYVSYQKLVDKGEVNEIVKPKNNFNQKHFASGNSAPEPQKPNLEKKSIVNPPDG